MTTKQERKILLLLTEGNKTVKQIADIINTSKSYIYRVRRKLISEGYISDQLYNFRHYKNKGGCLGGTQKTPYKSFGSLFGSASCGTKENNIRLHAEMIKIKVLWKDTKYAGSKFPYSSIIDGNKIFFYPNSIVIYSSKSFYGDNTDECLKNSSLYWSNQFNIIERREKIILVKDQYSNIDFCKTHFSEINNELATEYNKNKVKLQVRASEDGKVWLIIDDSYNLNEIETIKRDTNKADMDKVHAFFNDLRDNEQTTISDLKNIIYEHMKQTKETSAGLMAVSKVLQLIVKNLNK